MCIDKIPRGGCSRGKIKRRNRIIIIIISVCYMHVWGDRTVKTTCAPESAFELFTAKTHAAAAVAYKTYMSLDIRPGEQ